MSRVVVAYIAAGLGLFGALFVSFALTGLGRPAPLAQEIAAEGPAEPQAPLPGTFVPPGLEPGREYRLSHDTPIYSEPSAAAPNSQTVPAGGGFTAVRTLESPPGPWFEISINDGNGDRMMYLYGMDLRWKILTPVPSPDEVIIAARDAFLGMLRENGGFLGRAAPPEEAPPPPQPELREFSQWWADTVARLGGAKAANLIVSGVAAGITTALTLGAIAILSLFRRQNTWSRPMDHARAGEALDDDDPYASAHAQDVSDGHDDEDQRRA